MVTRSLAERTHRLMRDEALDVAARLLVTGGWRGLRLQDVADRVGISRQTLYNEFSSKQGLAAALVLRLTEQFLDSVEAALGGGDFILKSQLPAPQAGWAQQYTHDLKPAKARAFEPAGVCSAVTSRNLRALLELHLATGEQRFLAAFPLADKWLERSELADGRWATTA